MKLRESITNLSEETSWASFVETLWGEFIAIRPCRLWLTLTHRLGYPETFFWAMHIVFIGFLYCFPVLQSIDVPEVRSEIGIRVVSYHIFRPGDLNGRPDCWRLSWRRHLLRYARSAGTRQMAEHEAEKWLRVLAQKVVFGCLKGKIGMSLMNNLVLFYFCSDDFGKLWWF
jgi:hypothetical protein